jgi:hypothetical protein
VGEVEKGRVRGNRWQSPYSSLLSHHLFGANISLLQKKPEFIPLGKTSLLMTQHDPQDRFSIEGELGQKQKIRALNWHIYIYSTYTQSNTCATISRTL